MEKYNLNQEKIRDFTFYTGANGWDQIYKAILDRWELYVEEYSHNVQLKKYNKLEIL